MEITWNKVRQRLSNLRKPSFPREGSRIREAALDQIPDIPADVRTRNQLSDVMECDDVRQYDPSFTQSACDLWA